MKDEERNKAKIDMLELWIDIGAPNKAAALEKVAIADPITYKLGLQKLGDDFITSPGLDNKVGAFVVMEALRIASEKKIKCALYAVATVQEEIGLRGARTSCFGIDPLVGIAADVTHATDNPGADKKQAGDIVMGRGAVIDLGANINPVLGELFIDTAKKKKIPHQIAAAPAATGTDANAIQISRAGVAAGLISIQSLHAHPGRGLQPDRPGGVRPADRRNHRPNRQQDRLHTAVSGRLFFGVLRFARSSCGTQGRPTRRIHCC
jgi:putative aminopeptidase FrvX